MKTNRSGRQRAFSLIELMIAVAILAILAAVAIPSYVEHINRGRRAEAKAALLQAAHWQERFRTENNAYSCSLSTGLINVPPTGTTNYVLSVTVAGGGACSNPQAYTLVASRQAGSPVASDECLDFTLDNLGVRGLSSGGTPNNDATLIAKCWNR